MLEENKKSLKHLSGQEKMSIFAAEIKYRQIYTYN